VKLAILNKLTFFLLIVVSSYSSASDCHDTVFRYFKGKSISRMHIEACERNGVITSKTCIINCTFKKHIDKQKIVLKYQGVGSPHFFACHKSSGLPIIGEIRTKEKEWKKTMLCFDKRKKNFVNSRYLLQKLFPKK